MKRTYKGIFILLLSSSAFVLAAQNVGENQQKTQDDKFEYCLYNKLPWELPSGANKPLDTFGSEGWDLVAVTRVDSVVAGQPPQHTFVFKRKLGSRGSSCDSTYAKSKTTH